MIEKPTYEELEKRIQKLEQSESNHRQIEEGLGESWQKSSEKCWMNH